MSQPSDMRNFNADLVAAFRDTGGHGELGPVHFDKLVLLTTTGRRSGNRHTVPLGSVREGADDGGEDSGGWILFGSNMGSPTEPDWVQNIRVDPEVHVEVTDDEFDADAVVLSGEARGAAYQKWVDAAPHTASHQEQAGREIPMILVTKRD